MIRPAFLFDLDGTLLDTAPDFEYCLNQLLHEQKKPPIVLTSLREKVSFGAKGMLEFGLGLSECHPNFSFFHQKFLALYQTCLGQRTTFFPGVLTILQRLEETGLRWGIVTNKPTRFTHALLEKFPFLQKADCVVCGDSLSVQKPHAAPLLHACQQLAILPAHCWYVGDAKTDLEASRAAGMRCAIANYGYIPQAEDPSHWQADYYLPNIEALTALLV